MEIVFAIFLLTVAAIDIKTRMIYDMILLPMFIAGLVLTPIPIEEAMLNAALGFLITFAIMRLSGGLGGGDVKFCAVLGVWLGNDLFSAIFMASILAAIVGVICAVRFRSLKYELPFGPFLSLGAWLAFEFDVSLLY